MWIHPTSYRERLAVYKIVLIVSLLVGLVILVARAEPPAAEPEVAGRAALERFQPLVGHWKGVGQPKRGSSKDAWSEECEWKWAFAPTQTALRWVAPQGKWLKEARLESLGGSGFRLTGQTPTGRPLVLEGKIDAQGALVLLAKSPQPEDPARITLRTVAGGDRLVVLFEKPGPGENYTRLAEVGYTRRGSDFGAGTTYVECVVTGGVGTIPVTFEGKTYYVCCGGCRDYFNENPAEVLAEYRARRAAKAAEKAAGRNSEKPPEQPANAGQPAGPSVP